MKNLTVYTTPLEARVQLQHDSQFAVDGVDGADSNNRPCKNISIPDGTPSGWGCRIVVTADKKISIIQRGILYEEEHAWYFLADDFILQDVPPPVIIQPPNPIPTPPLFPSDPKGIIDLVYKIGKHDLSTKEGCGKFTEDCCKSLHDHHSKYWGHIRKSGAQNQFNGHAVDAVMLLSDSNITDNTEAGVYDLIIDSESPNAKPSFNFKHEPQPSLWYYPA
jgi:hypothetical protein